jgi:hypothetical protein
MPLQDTFLEKAWDDLLSRRPEKIRSRFDSLDKESQKTVLSHLQKMVHEEGWHPEQVKSAQAALETLTETRSKN